MNYRTSPAFTLAQSQKKSKLLSTQLSTRCLIKITQVLAPFITLGVWEARIKVRVIRLATLEEQKSIIGLNAHPHQHITSLTKNLKSIK